MPRHSDTQSGLRLIRRLASSLMTVRRSALLVAACVCVAFLATASAARANPLGEDILVPGGSAALAGALGIDPVPERARFVPELVRVVWAAPEGKSAASDTLRARLIAHLDIASRFRDALVAAERPGPGGGSGVSLNHAGQKTDRERLQRLFDIIGLKLQQKNKRFSVVQTDTREATERRQMLTSMGVELADIVSRLNQGESVHLELSGEGVPLALETQTWSSAVFQRSIRTDDLFAEVMRDRSASLLSLGLAALDRETLQFVAEQPALMRRLYEQDAAVFAAFAGGLRIRRGAVITPGGAAATSLWEAVLETPVTRPDRFVRELFSRREGRVAYVYDAVAHLDPRARAFALGLWIDDADRRLARFKSFLDAVEAFPGWGVSDRPFSRPSDDAVVMLTRVRADDRGVPTAPSWRGFWSDAFDGLDIPQDPARVLGNVEKDGVVDAAWFAEATLNAPTHLRAERLDQLAFGQRAFAGVDDTALPDALVAVRAFPRYRMLVLTLERMGVRSPGVYATSVRHAERLAALEPTRVPVALSQYQGALALLTRLARVHRFDVPKREALLAALANVPVTKDGYVGGIAHWLRSELMPSLTDKTTDVDVTLVEALAGRSTAGDAAPLLVSWEERDYRLNVSEAESNRIARTLQRARPSSVGQILELEGVASSLRRSDVRVTDVTAAIGQLTTQAAAWTPSMRDNVNAATRELSKITRPGDVQKARDAATMLLSVVDDTLAESLRVWAYAIDLGDSNGGRVISSEVMSRHDFGFVEQDNDRRLRLPWSEPEPVVQPGIPWHVTGALVGLDLGLSQTLLRRVSADMLPGPPRLLAADRDVFVKTVALQNPIDVTDDEVTLLVSAVAAGRQRVKQLENDDATFDEVADAIGMDGWRRSALRWTLTNDAANTLTYFSLADVLQLGLPQSSSPSGRIGVAAVARDGCLCMEFPQTGRPTALAGRSRGGQITSQVADLSLRVLLALHEWRLPAALSRGVLAAATQDYIDNVKPLYPDDWLTLVRSAQAISNERIADYVAALTVDGTLSPVSQAPRTR